MVFALWGVFLSGAVSHFTGSPGIIQALHLHELWDQKQTTLRETEEKSRILGIKERLLKSNTTVQEREVREVLGYARPTDLVFEMKSQ